MSVRIWRVVFVGAVAVSMVMLFSPASDVPTNIPVSDKVVHALIFLSLAVTALAARLGRPGLILLALVTYAGASEFLQEALPIGRDGSWGDLAADLIGLAIAFGLGWRLVFPTSANRTQG